MSPGLQRNEQACNPGGFLFKNIETRYEYNKANLVTLLVNKKRKATTSKFTYTYALDDNQLSKTDFLNNTVTYDYDRMGWLVQESDLKWQSIKYEYDCFSNHKHIKITKLKKYRTNYTYA